MMFVSFNSNTTGVDHCLSFCLSFGHFVDCRSSVYSFRFPLWYLQTVEQFDDGHILSVEYKHSTIVFDSEKQ